MAHLLCHERGERRGTDAAARPAAVPGRKGVRRHCPGGSTAAVAAGGIATPPRPKQSSQRRVLCSGSGRVRLAPIAGNPSRRRQRVTAGAPVETAPAYSRARRMDAAASVCGLRARRLPLRALTSPAGPRGTTGVVVSFTTPRRLAPTDLLTATKRPPIPFHRTSVDPQIPNQLMSSYLEGRGASPVGYGRSLKNDRTGNNLTAGHSICGDPGL